MAKEAKRQATFAPVPTRAIGDGNLNGLDLRVLAFIAAHDRFQANGIGCYTNQRKMATAVGTDHTRLNKTLRRLVDAGYIEAQPHPMNKRLRVYTVLYTEGDGAWMRGETVGAHANNADRTVGAHANTAPETVGTPEGQVPDNGERSRQNIFREAENTSGRSRGRYTPEGARSADRGVTAGRQGEWSRDRGGTIAEQLRRLETDIRRGCHLDLDAAADWLSDVFFIVEDDTNEYQWAARLHDMVHDMLEDA